MIENSDDLIQFSSPKPNLVKNLQTQQKTPKSLLDSSLEQNNTLVDTPKKQSESDDPVNESKLDHVDFIEVNELEQEDFWLCEPKTKHSNKENVNIIVTKPKAKNPYKWIVEEFDEDKDLDKVKRTLLVTLDDISKGFNRRSRSVSTTRTGYYNESFINGSHMAPPPPTPVSRVYEPESTPMVGMVQSKSIESILNESTADLNRTYSKESGLELINKTGTLTNAKPSIKQIFGEMLKSMSSSSSINNEIENLDENVFIDSSNNNEKSCFLIADDDDDDDDDDKKVIDHLSQIENYLKQSSPPPSRVILCFKCEHKPHTNSSSSSIVSRPGRPSIRTSSLEWDTEDVIDANFYQTNNKYGTIVKSKKNNHTTDENLIDISSNSPCNLTYSNENSLDDTKQDKYEDIVDVQVIAKMQEENLRQSVLNLSKSSINGYSTITKRVHPTRPSFPLQLPNDYTNDVIIRRDSASSSDHSSISSSASNYNSPYNSQVNVNSNEYFWDDDVVDLESGSVVSLNKDCHNLPVCSRCNQPLYQGTSNGIDSPKKLNHNYQTITKSTTITHGINSSVQKPNTLVSRSSTPSTRTTTNLSNRESRLPTPRTSRVAGTNLNASLNVTVKSAQSKSPSNFVTRNLQISKPPPAPLSNQTNQTPSTRRVLAYGSQRSATTSIVPSQTQIKAALLQKNQVQKQVQQKTAQIPRTSTNNSISSQSTNPTSPSSVSSLSASSSIHQMNGSSPRSRNHSPSQLISQLKISSPSGLMTDGPLGRRDRSASPGNTKMSNFGSQSNISLGSNSNLHTIAETRIPSHLNSPAMSRKLTSQSKVRKSFLPQPVQMNQTRQSSISPSRTRNVSPANWKDGCY